MDPVQAVERILRVVGTLISLIAALRALARWWREHGADPLVPPSE